MNISELEQIRAKRVKASENNEKEPVYCIEYLNQPPFKSLRDSIITQIGLCKRLLTETKDTYEIKAIEREILNLILILELVEY